jgi:hypothetical protein
MLAGSLTRPVALPRGDALSDACAERGDHGVPIAREATMHRQTRTQLRSRSAAGRCSAVVVRKSTCVAAALAGLLFIHPVAAQDPVPLKLGLYPERVEEPLEWRGRELHALDYVAAGALAMGAIVEWSLPSGEDPKRTGGILFDESLRNGLKLDDAAGRAGADMWSDLMFVVLTAYPAVVDAGATAALYHKRPEVARNMLVIDLQAFAFTSLTTGFLKRVADRERPIASECRTDPDHDPSCDTAGKHYSFPSGHTSMAFTGASLVCLHHAELGLLSTALHGRRRRVLRLGDDARNQRGRGAHRSGQALRHRRPERRGDRSPLWSRHPVPSLLSPGAWRPGR